MCCLYLAKVIFNGFSDIYLVIYYYCSGYCLLVCIRFIRWLSCEVGYNFRRSLNLEIISIEMYEIARQRHKGSGYLTEAFQ